MINYLELINVLVSVLLFLIILFSLVFILIDIDNMFIILIIYPIIAICCRIHYHNIFQQNVPENVPENVSENVPENVPQNIVALKVNNIDELNLNYSKECCICLENIDPIDSFKLSNCNFHIYHKKCINKYIDCKFTKCPICNIP